MARLINFPISVAFRVDPATAEKMRVVAAAYGLKRAEWARQIVTQAAGVDFEKAPVRRRTLHSEVLRDYLVELARQGGDLNRLAANLCTDGSNFISEADADLLQKLKHENGRLVDSVLDALGANREP